jgi:hypothetical protein
MKIFIYIYLYSTYNYCDQINEKNLPDQGLKNNLLIHINDFNITNNDVKILKVFFEEYYNKKLDQEQIIKEITYVILLYYWSCYHLPIEYKEQILSKENIIPENLNNNDFLKLIAIYLLNEKEINNMVYEQAFQEKQNTKENCNHMYRYILVSGRYTKIIPQITLFKDIMISNLAPNFKQKKYKQLQNLKIRIEYSSEIKPEININMKKKTFSYILHKNILWEQKVYHLLILNFDNIDNTNLAFDILKKNPTINIELFQNILQKKYQITMKYNKNMISSEHLSIEMNNQLDTSNIGEALLFSHQIIIVLSKTYEKETHAISDLEKEKRYHVAKDLILNMINTDQIKKIKDKIHKKYGSHLK